jgi:hypothetical protein
VPFTLPNRDPSSARPVTQHASPGFRPPPFFSQTLEEKVQESVQDRTIAVRNDEVYADELREIAKIRKKVDARRPMLFYYNFSYRAR